MKKVLTGVLFLSFIGGCTSSTPIIDGTESAKKTLGAIKQSLPAECKTDAINAQIEALDAQINNIPAMCQAQVAPIEAERDRLRLLVAGIIGLLMLSFWRK